MQRRASSAVLCGGSGLIRHQQLHQVIKPIKRRQVRWRIAIAVCGLCQVGVFNEQRLYRFAFTVADRMNDIRVVRPSVPGAVLLQIIRLVWDSNNSLGCSEACNLSYPAH